MRRLLALATLAAAPLVAQVVPQPEPVPSAAAKPPARGGGGADGMALFVEKCGMCHGKVGMGTGLLGRRVQPAELLLRTDLDPDYVFQAARVGIGNMPPVPRGEASDVQLRAIAAMLAKGPAGRAGEARK